MGTVRVKTVGVAELEMPTTEAELETAGPAGLLCSELAVGSSRVDLQACKLEYSIVSPK